MVTVADQIISALRSGNYLEPAAAAAGVDSETVYGWLKVAGRARLRAKGRSLDEIEMTDHERKCLEFSGSVLHAWGIYETAANVLLTQLERGGLETTSTSTKQVLTERVIDGELKTVWTDVERYVRVTVLPPDPKVLMWRLERRFQERYGNKVDVAISSKRQELTEEEHADELINGLQAFLEGIEEQPQQQLPSGNGRS